MPASRVSNSRRRRSSLGYVALGQPKYSSQIVTFAPNVTPTTFTASSEDDDEQEMDQYPSLFPPSMTPAPVPSRRRVPPGKRRSLGYIPRPPNAFMLFRADFVRQKHVPGSLETTHGSLSKIIGSCWRNLSPEDKRIWEIRAKKEKEEHKRRYPDYRFRPVHTKGKKKDTKEKPMPTEEEEQRVEEVAQLLLQGKKGYELAEAVRAADAHRAQNQFSTATLAAPLPTHFQPTPMYGGIERYRRSSSVPLPDITLPSISFLSSMSRPASPGQRMMHYPPRRPSSAGAMFSNWTHMPQFHQEQQHQESHILPDMDASLFSSSFSFADASFTSAAQSPFNIVAPHDQNGITLPPLSGYPSSMDSWAPVSGHGSYENSPTLSTVSSLPSAYPTEAPYSAEAYPVDASYPVDIASSYQADNMSYPIDPSYGSSIVAPQPVHYGEADMWKTTLPPLNMHAVNAGTGMGGEYPSPYGIDGLTLYDHYAAPHDSSYPEAY